jgi:N,N-dimethylformamidase
MSGAGDARPVGEPIGYSDVWSVAPGEWIRFMVSTLAPTYRPSLVRLTGTTPGNEIAVPGVLEGERRGRRQVARAGSCVCVEPAWALRSLRSVTVCAWAWPTRPGAGEQALVANEAWMLFVGEDGRLRFRVRTQAEEHEVFAARRLPPRTWSFVCGSYDAARGEVRVRRHELGLYAAPSESRVLAVPAADLVPGADRVLMGAGGVAPTGAMTWGTAHFDGKLEAPTVFDRALADDEIAMLLDAADDAALALPGLIAAWRFEHGMTGDQVTDAGPLGLHGQTVNAPTRAMTGHLWRARTSDPRTAPREYGALHFHADNLDDAGWESDIELCIPESLASGVYAARLDTADGGKDLVPFVVPPPRGRTTAQVALVLPTFTYLVYANEKVPDLDSYQSYRLGDGFRVSPWDAWLAAHPELGMSLYDVHADGSGCCYSSRLRPIPSLRPDYVTSVLGFPRHLAADLLLIEWLARIGVDVDVLTDEDLHDEGVDALAGYRVVLTGSHPEYVSEQILDGFEGYVARGGRLMYLGGNGFFWVTSADDRDGHRVEVRRGRTGRLPWDSEPGELHHSTTGELGGLWQLRGRPARELVGVGYTAIGLAARPYRRTEAACDSRYSWVFDGLAEDALIDGGRILGHPGGYEIDCADTSLGSPDAAVVLATASAAGGEFELFSPGVNRLGAAPGQEDQSQARADMVLLETATGGAVFSVGSIAWVGGLVVDGRDNPVATVTRNVLTRFLETAGPVGRAPTR